LLGHSSLSLPLLAAAALCSAGLCFGVIARRVARKGGHQSGAA
jgi:hypothetical protein